MRVFERVFHSPLLSIFLLALIPFESEADGLLSETPYQLSAM
jgi:hypothetical protein